MIKGIKNQNLRDRGYPDSRTYNPNSQTRFSTNALMTDDIDTQLYDRILSYENRRKESDFHKFLEKTVDKYKPFQESHPNMPQLSFYDPTKNYEHDTPVDYSSGIIGENPLNGHKSFLLETSSSGRLKKNYSAALNGLSPLLGTNSFYGRATIPIGRLAAAYNGDVLYGNFEPTPFDYYYEALKAMLNSDKGEL